MYIEILIKQEKEKIEKREKKSRNFATLRLCGFARQIHKPMKNLIII
jgi:hypothetical protein